MNLCKDEIICDLAEYYHILNMDEIPTETLATLVIGLRDDSRTMLKLTDRKVSIDRLINAIACDNLSLILWSKTKDGQHNRNRPKRLIDVLLDTEAKDKFMSFEDADDFQKAWEKINNE